MHHHSDHRSGGRGRMFREAWRAYAEQMAAGRGFGGRGRGRHRGEDDGDGAEGFGRFGSRGGRLLGHGDLRLLLLALIGEKPRHGYDLIRAVEERFAGAYAPSPGAVYPTLTMLEEQDLIRAEAAPEGSGGSKRLYAITPEGKAFLKENEALVDGIFTRIAMVASHHSSRAAPDEVWEAWKTLKQAMNMPRAPWTDAEAERIRAILMKAARDIVGKG
ncbi:MAG: PadR family transcriptional regulator [Hyphomonadaceae bacterium]|nr:PadR family transcriptional regulator [Hyphomonadaceae bacterium]